MPVTNRAVAASSGDDSEARKLLGAGYFLDEAEEWAAIMVIYGGQTRVASSLPPQASHGC